MLSLRHRGPVKDSIPDEHLIILAQFQLCSKPFRGYWNDPKRFSDYQAENRGYLEVLDMLRGYTCDYHLECYRCELYYRGRNRCFIPKPVLAKLSMSLWDWVGRNIHPSALETFLGSSACVRCAAAILLSDDPVLTMRASLRWEPPEDSTGAPQTRIVRSRSSPGLMM